MLAAADARAVPLSASNPCVEIQALSATLAMCPKQRGMQTDALNVLGMSQETGLKAMPGNMSTKSVCALTSRICCLTNQMPNNAVSSIIMLTSSASPSAAELVLGPSPEEASMEVAVAAVTPLLLLA